MNPGRTTPHVSQNLCQEITICRKPPSGDGTSDELPKLQLKIGSVRGLINATLLQRIPRSTMIAQLGGPTTADLSQMLRVQGGVLVCDFKVQSRAPWFACSGCWNTFIVAKPVGSSRCVNPTRQTRKSTSLQTLAPIPPHSWGRLLWCCWPPRRASRVRASSWARRLPHPHSGTRRCASLFWLPSFSMLRRRHGTTTAHASFVNQGSLGHDEHALPGACTFTSGGSPGDHPERI